MLPTFLTASKSADSMFLVKERNLLPSLKIQYAGKVMSRYYEVS